MRAYPVANRAKVCNMKVVNLDVRTAARIQWRAGVAASPMLLRWSYSRRKRETKLGISAGEYAYGITVLKIIPDPIFPERLFSLYPEYCIRLVPKAKDSAPASVVLRYRQDGGGGPRFTIEQLPPDSFHVEPVFADEAGPVGTNRAAAVAGGR